MEWNGANDHLGHPKGKNMPNLVAVSLCEGHVGVKDDMFLIGGGRREWGVVHEMEVGRWDSWSGRLGPFRFSQV